MQEDFFNSEAGSFDNTKSIAGLQGAAHYPNGLGFISQELSRHKENENMEMPSDEPVGISRINLDQNEFEIIKPQPGLSKLQPNNNLDEDEDVRYVTILGGEETSGLQVEGDVRKHFGGVSYALKK
jgi:hypothetical protein